MSKATTFESTLAEMRDWENYNIDMDEYPMGEPVPMVLWHRDLYAAALDQLEQTHASTLSALREENERLREALGQIAAIQNRTWGGEWDEIEEARGIADAALTPKDQSNG